MSTAFARKISSSVIRQTGRLLRLCSHGLLAILALALPATARQTRPLTIPCGSAAKVDGRLEPREWADAAAIPLIQDSQFMAKVSAADLFVAVRLPSGSYRYADLYVYDSTGRLLNLHASMKQGQRVLMPGWSDAAPPFDWNPQGWDSSIAHRTGSTADTPITEQIEGLEGYEMRVPLALLGRPPLKIRVEVRDFEGNGGDWIYPVGSTRTVTSSWANLRPWPSCK